MLTPKPGLKFEVAVKSNWVRVKKAWVEVGNITVCRPYTEFFRSCPPDLEKTDKQKDKRKKNENNVFSLLF